MKTCNCAHDGPPPKFLVGQTVRATYKGTQFLGKINCVIAMKRRCWDYYVTRENCHSTIRCSESDIKAIEEVCHCCVKFTPPPPKFHIGQRVRTTFGKDDHCGTVVAVNYSGWTWPTGQIWYYTVRMCPDDKGSAIKDGIRHHAESLFKAVGGCCNQHCGCCYHHQYCCCR